MKKKIVTMIAAGLLVLSMTACGENSNNTDASAGTEVSDTADAGEDDTADEEKSITEISEIEDKYKFVLDGGEYQLMYTKLSDLFNDGWGYDDMYADAQGIELEPLTYGDIYIQKGEASISIRVINLEEENRVIEDCEVAQITISSDMSIPFRTGEGISIGSTIEEAKEAYGVYDYGFTEGDTGISYNFYSSYNNNNNISTEIHIDGLDEQSLGKDTLKFQTDEGSDVINYIFMEYYPYE